MPSTPRSPFVFVGDAVGLSLFAEGLASKCIVVSLRTDTCVSVCVAQLEVAEHLLAVP